MGNHEKGIAPLEKFLFGFARLVALIGAVAAIGGIVFCGLFLMGTTTVSYEEIASMHSPSREASGKGTEGMTSASLSYRLPQNLEPYLAGDNKKVLDGWLKGLDSDKQREDFLGNLSKVVAEAVSKGADRANVADTINTYKDLKLKRLSPSEIEKYTAVAARGAAIAVILGLVVLLLLGSLMLVLLAIERHVRIATATSPTQPANP